jgi:Ca2+-binding EF-hand superfamily protein
MQLSLQSLDIKKYVKQEVIDVAMAIFKKFDKGAKGWIETKDLGTMLRILEYNPTDRELKDMIDKLEEDPNNVKGQISREGFLACIARKSRDTDTIDEFLNSFKVFDPEGKGLIEEKIMRFILCKMGENNLLDEEMDLMVKEAANGDFISVVNDVKYIRYADFALFIKDMYVPPVKVNEEKKGKQPPKKK